MKHRLLVTVPALISAMVLSASAALAAPVAKVDRAITTVGGCSQAATTEEQALKPEPKAHQDHGKHLGQNKDGQKPVETDNDSDESEDQGEGDRPQNHGWFVSQAAHDDSFVGREHGKHVSEVARGDEGKPDQADH